MPDIQLTSAEWTLICSDVTDFTFQNLSSRPVYLAFNSTSTIPDVSSGIIYGPFQGHLKRVVSDFTYISDANHVFAKCLSGSAKVYVEQE